jgi:two-component system cell cycle sensor histidine kinase/response regulator CckA
MAKARILVVDDEPVVLSVVAGALTKAGHEVTTAAGPLQALEIVTTRGGFDVLVTDIVMPEMCGPELAQQTRLLLPLCAVVFMSGCAPAANRFPEGSTFLGKPFSVSALLRAVERVIAEPSRCSRMAS